MPTHTSKRTRLVQNIVESDRREAVIAAEQYVVAQSLELAPLSYAELTSVRAVRFGAVLANLPDHLIRPQAIRFLAERCKATGRSWGWGTVDALEAWMREQIAAARAAATQQEETMEDEHTPAPAAPTCTLCGGALDSNGRCANCDGFPGVIATSPTLAPDLVDEVLAGRQREAQSELDKALFAGDLAAARFAHERCDAVGRARRYLDRAAKAGQQLVSHLPAGDWQIVGSRGTPYTVVVGEGLKLECSCDHGIKLREALAAAARGETVSVPRGICWHTELISAVEEALDLGAVARAA